MERVDVFGNKVSTEVNPTTKLIDQEPSKSTTKEVVDVKTLAGNSLNSSGNNVFNSAANQSLFFNLF